MLLGYIARKLRSFSRYACQRKTSQINNFIEILNRMRILRCLFIRNIIFYKTKLFI
jgi:hypothetical protein